MCRLTDPISEETHLITGIILFLSITRFPTKSPFETHPGQQALINTLSFSLAKTWVKPFISALETE